MEWSDQQEAIFAWFKRDGQHLVVRARAGTGKCLGRGTPVLMSDGTVKAVEDVVVGDTLMGPDSEPRTVLSTNRGHGPLFRVDPVKGESWVCNDVHVLTLAGTNRFLGQVRDVSLQDLIQESKGRIDRNWKLMRSGVSFPSQTFDVAPYLVGVWVGDGSTGTAQITSPEPEIVDYCQRIAGQYGTEVVTRRDEGCWNIRFRVGERGGDCRNNPNFLHRFFAELSVQGKRIPLNYLINDENVRLELLAGIIDSDGYLPNGGGYELMTVSDVLAVQYLYLARSLGFAAYDTPKRATIKSTGFVGMYHRITISGDVCRIPCKVPRKQANTRQQIKRVTVTGFTVEAIGDGEYFGFTLDGDGRFLLGDFTVTHNTTTIIEAIGRLPQHATIALVAFNKSIATELQARVRHPGCTAKTLHSFGFSNLMRNWRGTQVDGDRSGRLAQAACGNAPADIVKLVEKLSDKAKDCEPYAEQASELFEVMDRFDLNPEEDEDEQPARPVFGPRPATPIKPDRWTRERVATAALKAMLAALEPDGFCSYADMIYVPVRLGWIKGTFDYVIVDEAQDMSPLNLALCAQLVRRGGHIIVVGDDRQSIYGFRGAALDAIDGMKRDLGADELPLTITRRCPKSVVALAQRLVPDFEAHPEAPDGVVRVSTEARMVAEATPGDYILSRVNAPLARIAMSLLRRGVRCKIEGRDIGKGLLSVIDKLDARSIPDLIGKVQNWQARQIKRFAKLSETKRAAKLEALEDQVSTILSLCEGLTGVRELRTRLSSLFEDTTQGAASVVCSSIHKAKGREADRVFLLTETLYPGGRHDRQEENLEYVAITRAKRELVLVRTEIR